MNFLKHLGRFLWRSVLGPTLLVATLPVTLPLWFLVSLGIEISNAWKDAAK